MRVLFTAQAFNALAGSDRRNVHPAPPRRRRRRRRGRGRRVAAAVVGVCLGLALLTAVAHAAGSVYEPAPAYPNSALSIDVVGKPRAGGIAKVMISGTNAPFEVGYHGSGDYIAYQLDAFAQNGKVLPDCPRTFMAELQNQVSLGISRIAQGFTEGYFGPFNHLIAFRTSRRIRKVTVCAYSRMIDDDAAVSALGFKLRPPRR